MSERWPCLPPRAAMMVGMLSLVAAFGLKLAFSKAGAPELAWVLAPSCQLAEQISALQLTPEAGAGWISHRPRMVVGPACAGVNFLVACWLALYFGSQGRLVSVRRKLCWWGLSLLAAYVATLAANGVRIALAARLLEADLYAGWLTPARAHRLLGIAVYCGALLAVTKLARVCIQRLRAASAPGPTRLLGPLSWYLAIAVGVPLANRAYMREPAHFAEHVVMTVVAAAAILGIFRLIGRLVDRVS